jgi:uncharacterized protein (DUF924 family)
MEPARRLRARFGRFPFRNQVLGRQSSDEELAFLAEFEGRQAPRVMREEATKTAMR